MARRIGESSLWSRKVSILVDLLDLAVCSFKHHGDLGDLWCLLKSSKLISGHGQVGAWGLVDIVAVNTDKFVIKVALELA